MSKTETTLVCPCCQRADRLEHHPTARTQIRAAQHNPDGSLMFTEGPDGKRDQIVYANIDVGPAGQWWCDRCNGWMSNLPPTAQHPDLPKRGTRKRRGT